MDYLREAKALYFIVIKERQHWNWDEMHNFFKCNLNFN